MTNISESVTHLRSVHFSLLVACFALYGLSVAGKSQDFDKALGQLSEIEVVLSRWEPQWLESVAAMRVDQKDSVIGTAINLGVDCGSECVDKESLVPFGSKINTQGFQLRSSNRFTLLPLPKNLLEFVHPENTPDPFSTAGPLWSGPGKLSQRDPQFIQPIPTIYPLTSQPFEFAAPKTLEEFETYWNALNITTATVTFAIDQSVGAIGIGASVNSLQRLYVADNLDSNWPEVSLRLEPMTEIMKATWRDITEHSLAPEYHYIGFTPWGKVSVPVLVHQFQLDASLEFIDFYDVDWSPGSLATNVPELSALTLHTSEHNFDKLKAILQSESGRAQDDIELFGLTIPTVVVAKWGGPLVVLVQLYFILHLRALCNQVGLTRDLTLAPWIGIYSDVPSRVTTAVSAFALPPFFLGLITLPDISSNPGLVIIVVLSVGLGALSFQVILKLWRNLNQMAD